MKKVLIAFASRYGSTVEISQKIAEILEKEGISPTLINLKDKKRKKNLDLNEFDGILVGSGIRIGAWTKESKNFVTENKEILVQKVFGAYISCGEGINPEKCEEAKGKYIDNVMTENNLSPALSEAFGGVLDLSEDSKMGFFSKKMMSMAAKEDPNIKKGIKNDFRNWEQIANYAKEFANLIK